MPLAKVTHACGEVRVSRNGEGGGPLGPQGIPRDYEGDSGGGLIRD